MSVAGYAQDNGSYNTQKMGKHPESANDLQTGGTPLKAINWLKLRGVSTVRRIARGTDGPGSDL